LKAPVLLLFGPTASGKTALLERLFAGPKAPFKAEIVSADSMQVYRGMDIGTAKPSPHLRSILRHHLIDIRDPSEVFSLGDFVPLAQKAWADIASRGALPVISGGTGFYLKNFVLGLPETPPSDLSIREQVRTELAERGAAALMAELRLADPVSAARIHLNDTYRLTRALEVFRSTGRPLSSFAASGSAPREESDSIPDDPSTNNAPHPEYDFLCLGLDRDRDELYRRINERTRAMFDAGLPEEVSILRAAGYGPDSPGMRAIGYREFFLEDGTICTDHEALISRIAQNSRHYAKRQITFFSAIPGARFIPAGDEDMAVEEIRRAVEGLLGNR